MIRTPYINKHVEELNNVLEGIKFISDNAHRMTEKTIWYYLQVVGGFGFTPSCFSFSDDEVEEYDKHFSVLTDLMSFRDHTHDSLPYLANEVLMFPQDVKKCLSEIRYSFNNINVWLNNIKANTNDLGEFFPVLHGVYSHLKSATDEVGELLKKYELFNNPLVDEIAPLFCDGFNVSGFVNELENSQDRCLVIAKYDDKIMNRKRNRLVAILIKHQLLPNENLDTIKHRILSDIRKIKDLKRRGEY